MLHAKRQRTEISRSFTSKGPGRTELRTGGLEKHAVSQVTSLLVSEARLRRRRSRHEKAPLRSSGCDSKGLEKSMPPADCQLAR